jgi:putative flippase GtrA
MDKLSEKSTQLKQNNKTLWQFITFTLLSLVTTVIELGIFSLLNYVLLTSLKATPFHFWVFTSDVLAGGLCAFLAYMISFVISQTFNFFIHRKVTFSANNNQLYSGIMYGIMVLSLFFLQLWIPQLFREWLSGITGPDWADFILKNSNMTLSFLIQFPMNKWVIMRQKREVISLN